MPVKRQEPDFWWRADFVQAKAQIDKRGPDDCWPWKGHQDPKGYGLIHIHGHTVKAHRFFYWVKHDQAPDVVLHTCDNPSCVNPRHLRGGTSTDNNRETVWKGRHRPRRGNTHHNAKLDGGDVRMIRIMHKRGHSVKFLAEYNNVSAGTIRDIVAYKRWRHVP